MRPSPWTLILLVACVVVCAAIHPLAARAQAPANLQDATPGQTLLSAPTPSSYSSQSEGNEWHSYLDESFGPYPLVISAFVSGYHQARRNPPDWREGFPGYAERYGSDFGISVINVSTRYALAEATDEDVYYYRCSCSGIWPRLKHAVSSTVIARNQIDGHSVFAFPSVAAPYAGPLVATRAWYPPRYGPKDAFRMGNYGLLDYAISNIALEFLPDLLPAKSHSWITRLHLENRHGAQSDPAKP